MRVFLYLIFFFFSDLSFSSPPDLKIVDRVAVIVNTEAIYLSDLNAYRKKLKQGGLVEDTLLRLSNPEKLLEDRGALIQHLINEQLLESEIKKQNIQISQEQIEKEIRNISTKNNMSINDLGEALNQRGVKFSDYQEFIRKTLERQTLIGKEISSKISISDDEIAEEFLRTAGSKFKSQEFFEFELSHILFSKARGGSKAAEERATNVYSQLLEGKDFSDLASKFSDDPYFTQGGVLGTFKVNEMRPELAKNVLNLEPGQHTKIMLTSDGNYQIIKVTKKRLIANPHLDSARSQILSELYEKAFKIHMLSWLERKRQESFVKVNMKTELS